MQIELEAFKKKIQKLEQTIELNKKLKEELIHLKKENSNLQYDIAKQNRQLEVKDVKINDFKEKYNHMKEKQSKYIK